MTPEERIERRKYLGASEIAAVCGMDPFRGVWDVWADKLGLIPPESFAESDMGHLFERPLLEHYSRKTGVALTYPEVRADLAVFARKSQTKMGRAGK